MRYFYKKLLKKYNLALYSFLLIFGIPSDVTYGENKMESLFSLDIREGVKPQIHDLKQEIDHLFAVPRDNAVGTTDINNAITLLRFQKRKIIYDEVAADFLRYVSAGTGPFLPVFHPDIIGYAQVRGFVLFNLKTKRFTDHRICYPIEETIENVHIANAAKRQFVFEIEKFPKESDGSGYDYTKHLRLMDLSGKEAMLIKEVEIGRHDRWVTEGRTIFLLCGIGDIKIFSLKLEPDFHPLFDIVQRIKNEFNTVQVAPHPFLPFSVLVPKKGSAIVASWGQNRQELSPPLFRRKTTKLYEYSPDGKWVVFREGFSTDTKVYLMPVSERYPHYLGSPILLHERNFMATAWTQNPISFVGSTFGKLYRWELTNEAHPESDKATFHDYIVERDLERIKKKSENK